MHDFLILGASGMQGAIVTRDLIESGFSVFVSSHSTERLDAIRSRYPGIQGATVDFREGPEAIQDLMERANPRVVINCAEGDWNIDVYRAALAAKTHVIDLGSDIHMTKQQIELDGDFAGRGLCAITGCGSTPGVNNVALAYAMSELDEVHTVEAGFAWDSNIKSFVVPFSMESILEEFTRPAAVLEHGVWLEKSPLHTVERRTFRDIGEQRCLLVPHPEVYTFHHDWRERGLHTVRFYAGFPDHSFDVIESLVGGLDGKGNVAVPGEGLVPVGSLTNVCQRLYPRPANYQEREILWVTADGVRADKPVRIAMECLVPTLPDWGDAGCNIDTGFPASIIAQMILDGTITARGSFASGSVIPWAPFMRRLTGRGMTFFMNGRVL